MRRILLLGMAMLLSMALSEAKADDRQVIYEETFAEGLGSFTVVDEGFPDSKPETWHWDDSGCASITESQLADGYRGYSYLTSPVIDLTNWHNATYSFDFNVAANSKVYTLQIKDGDSEWRDVEEWIYTETIDEFRKSTTYYLSRYNGHQIQIRFKVQMNQYTNFPNTNRIKNIRFEGEVGAASDEPVKVNNIQEFLALPDFTFAEVELDDAQFTCTTLGKFFLKDNSAAMCCTGTIWEKGYKNLLGPFPGLRFTGKMTGVRTRQFGYNEMSDAVSDGRTKSPEDMFEGGGHWTSFTTINEEQIEEYDCQNIRVSLRDPDMQYFFFRNNSDEPNYTIHYTRRILCNAVAYLTHDCQKRLMFIETSGYIWGMFNDEEPYDYSENSEISTSTITREFKQGQWNSASFPFDINKTIKDSYSYKDCQFAVLTNVTDGVFYFQSIDFSNGEIIEAGTPFLIKPSSDWHSIPLGTLKDVSGQFVVNAGDYNFVGTLEPVQPADGSYYLTANNTIKPLASGGTIKAFRAYFEPAIPNAAKARAFCIDGMTTAIEDIVGGEELFGIPQKVYTVNGQYAGDDLEALPKGVYIVNGKKIIK